MKTPRSKGKKAATTVDLSFARVDTGREERCGAPEVIYSPGKTPAQIIKIARALHAAGQPVLATRIDPKPAAIVKKALKGSHYNQVSRLLTWKNPKSKIQNPKFPLIGVCAAGTSDLPVAEEAAQTAEFYGFQVDRVYDVGVAGIHRLLAQLPRLQRCRLLIVVAGMEGALPSAVAGLVSCPVIGVPTSTGYGANLEGITAFLGMLTSCASGLTVVNIDNGFGAAAAALRTLR